MGSGTKIRWWKFASPTTGPPNESGALRKSLTYLSRNKVTWIVMWVLKTAIECMLKIHISLIISSNLGKIHVTGITRLTTVLKFNIE